VPGMKVKEEGITNITCTLAPRLVGKKKQGGTEWSPPACYIFISQ